MLSASIPSLRAMPAAAERIASRERPDGWEADRRAICTEYCTLYTVAREEGFRDGTKGSQGSGVGCVRGPGGVRRLVGGGRRARAALLASRARRQRAVRPRRRAHV